ncbi:MAG TPA: hypothetical protein DF296_04835 [Candidatus Margulisbacteria bacterium]|nr:MAG: hypothetical protein A2X43_08550 [Candidatus Margulisbacteria bacterium GWD2_39_127]OGI05099.1 MAG: hypothetical protein A2X42_12565 [Candidatus Margulisbacteria bacterium GWF2_38_17]OGI09199.1 MAG: hypothetical protein A2X41_01325 [Candidatus Margulisbacteria bacterium GWE2_39_32]HAR63077.1 hypothetical protein [Candidatus Margulisiibacteriota bacterium]HCT84505.1 hypothetical protein [Candidatus Margulisiibacteriota bacterium]
MEINITDLLTKCYKAKRIGIKGYQLVRYYGLYINKSRGKRAKMQVEVLEFKKLYQNCTKHKLLI